MRFLRRGTCRAVGHHHPDQNRHQCSTKAHENRKPRQKDSTGRPLAGKQGTKGGTCRPWLIDGRGKAWSKRPNRQAGRHGRKRPPLRGAKTGTKRARPTSRPPAQPGACARHAGKVRVVRESEKTGLSGRGASIAARNRLQWCAEAARRAFKGKDIGKGRAGRKNVSVSLWRGLQDLPR